ncbi:MULTISPECIES: P-loop NTPase fold protein [Streptococcus]|jgi:hypothetical protein|uniref:P-loop NTPase fold protein n=1 Tax=Streptococcus TaxID=1301 RepID=UPI00066B34CA|nr:MULTISPECIES: P-loop NTPase fold protein [Streptococcus]MCB7061823.1 hypothetical protein [Streptococcus sp. 210928-DFI.4.42]MDU2418661.1 P-loop NTPase fold protein [Streptococcus parasanguinis]MDU2684377.1 P-loop NTPase fold protein [Streptococcus parasanguinis]
MKEKNSKIDHIDTSIATKQFSNMIVEKDENKNYKTFFLNGIWGSGKTTFLKDTEKDSEGNLKKNRWKVRYLKLWEIKNDRSVFELAFAVLFPKYNFFAWFFVIISIVISLLLTPTFNLGLSKIVHNLISSCIKSQELSKFLEYIFIPILKSVFTIVALTVSTFELLKLKSDSFYIFLFNRKLRKKKKKVVLVVDDFDRVSSERQKEAYKLFNVIHGKIPIIFVGDLDKITIDSDRSLRFLNKIIDKRVELPVAINSKNVLKNYISSLKEQLRTVDKYYYHSFNDIYIDDFLDKDFLNSNLTLREINQFKSLLDSEISKKEGRVRLSQQIVIIYLYLFDYQNYNELRNNYDSNSKKVRMKGFYEKDETKYKNINKVLFEARGGRCVPLGFDQGPVSYFINDNIENLSVKEAEDKLIKMYEDIEIINSLGENTEEFLEYINQTDIELENLKTLLHSILLKITDQKFQDIASIVVNKINMILSRDRNNKNNDVFWIDVTKEIDISKRCYFYVKYRIFSDNIPFSTIREDLLGYINTSQKIENIPEVAFSLLQGEILNYKNDKLNIIKIFNSDIKNKEKNFGVLKNYFGIQEKSVNNENQYIIENTFKKDLNVTPFVEFFYKEVLTVNSENTV